jgi:menaquinone-specific isochorismate synthase
MEHFSDSTAWLARRDGSMLIGHGPFVASPTPPADGVAFYVQDFALGDQNPWKTPSHIERTSSSEMATRLPRDSSLTLEWTPTDAVPFSVIFQEIMAAIHDHRFEKTVPVVTEHGTASEAPGPAICAAMIQQSAPLQSYGWTHEGQGFAGATPELLFSLQGEHLETMALAGTAKSEDREVFAVDEKEIREHEYVAQTLVSKLLDLGEVDRFSREILDLGTIVHFLTLICLHLKSPQSPEALLRRLHPTPALGPLPRNPDTLGMLFDWRRRLGCPAQFGAPFGLWDHGRFDAVVCIRGIWWNDRNLSLPAGCGIIEPSRLVNEWREIRLKRDAVKRYLAQP